MEDMELAAFDGLTDRAAEDRGRVGFFVATTGLPKVTPLGLETGVFFTASGIDARGRAAELVLPVEPVGEIAELRTATTASEDGFVFVEADREAFGAGDAEGFVGTTEALRVVAAVVVADFEEAEDIAGRDVAAGADVVGFFNGGAAAFGTAVAAGPVAMALEPVGLTEAAPNVPELII